MRCPSCGKAFRRTDFDTDEVYFECNECEVPLVGPGSAGSDGPGASVETQHGPYTQFYQSAPPRPYLFSSVVPGSAEAYARGYDKTIIFRRWFACVVDYALLGGVLLGADYLLGNEIYQKTLLVWLLVVILYYPILEGMFGVTVGKLIVAIRVVDENGALPGMKRACLRFVLRLVEVNPFLFGGIPAGLVALFSSANQRLGDMVAHTYVLTAADATALRQLRASGLAPTQ